MIRFTRLTHRYLGIFIAPAVLFFSFSGGLQMFSFHEATRAPGYKPPAWIVLLSRIHKNGAYGGRAEPPPAKPAAQPGSSPNAAPNIALPKVDTKPPITKWKINLPLKLYFGFVALGLFISTLSGLYMAYKFERNRWLVTALLAGGTILPWLLLRFTSN